MKKRIGSVLLALALCLSLLPATALAEGEGGTTTPGAEMPTYSGGSGTAEDPWLISTVQNLQTLAETVNSGKNYENQYFVLTSDLDLQNINWTPIGNTFANALFNNPDYVLFAGNFDGKCHTISKLSIGTADEPVEADVFGLFGATSGKISNLNLDAVTIHGTAKNVSGYVIGLAGALAGFAGGPIENCHVTNLSMTMNTPDSGMTAAYWIGGLVGVLDERQYIKECSASGTINELSGKGSIGGLIGELGKAAKITYSHADVALDVESDSRGGDDVGGLIGKGNGDTDSETVISNCYATGDVTGGAYSGGFAGSLWGLNIKNCYATGDVTGAAASMATFAGTDASAGDAYGSVTNCYTTGTLSGKAAYMYAFTMQQKGTPRSPTENCYFADTNSALINLNETTVFKALAEMQTEGFKDTLNANDPANGWLFREGKTPLCGAEPADYSGVEAALANIPEDMSSYTEESVNAVNAAKNNVVTGKIIAKQADVDAMAQAIENAITALVKKPSPGSSSSRPSYPITTPDNTENGSVNISSTSAKRGSTVTITVTPDAGYVLDELTVTDKDGKELSLTKKSDTEYTFVMPAGKVEITPSFVKQTPSQAFVDVKTGDYFYDAVQWAVGKGITNGTSAETFSPEDPCTRAQIVTFLWRAAGSPVVNYAMDLSDVAGDAYYAEAVRWALSEGITTGTSADQFSPDATCTREQAVTFLYRAAGSPAVSGESAFEDVGADAYYARAVAWAAQNGVTNGISQALFGTGSDCTRAQIVTFLYRAQQGK